MRVVSPCFYENNFPARRLINSCEKFGYNLHLYGQRETFSNWYEVKVVRLLEELKTLDDEYVIYADAADTWFIKPPMFIEDLLDYSGRIVISSETQCYPDSSFAPTFAHIPGAYKYPCAGLFVGEREYIIDWLEYFKTLDFGTNDQAYWIYVLALNDEDVDIDIDFGCDFFQTMANYGSNDMPRACALHFNGGAKEERMAQWENR